MLLSRVVAPTLKPRSVRRDSESPNATTPSGVWMREVLCIPPSSALSANARQVEGRGIPDCRSQLGAGLRSDQRVSLAQVINPRQYSSRSARTHALFFSIDETTVGCHVGQ